MSNKLILLFDHDESVREVIHVCLQHLAGWRVISVGDSGESLETLITWKPDMILLDVFLPKNNGLEFIQKLIIQKLKENPLTQAVPILLISDEASWFSTHQLKAMGVAGAIAKPFDPIMLPTQIARILGWNIEKSAEEASVTPKEITQKLN